MTNLEAKKVMAILSLYGFKSAEDTIDNLKKNDIDITSDTIIEIDSIYTNVIMDEFNLISTSEYSYLVEKYRNNDDYLVLTQGTRSPVLDYYEVTIISPDTDVKDNVKVYKDDKGKNIIIMFYKEVNKDGE